MTLDEACAQVVAMTESVNAQREANQAMLDSGLDAADRIVMRKAADATIQLAEMPATDPT